MIVSFFEEFPTKENLNKVKLIDFPTKLYIAAESIEQLIKIKKQIKSKYVKEVIWWPILKKEEGYWFSPFSSKKAMERILKQINNQKTMIDLEWPYKKIHILTKFYRILHNRKILKTILKNTNTIPCENFMENSLMKFLKLNSSKQTKIKMIYTSYLKLPRIVIIKKVKNLAKKYSDLKIGLGLIAHGVEAIKQKLLSPEQIYQDLELCKKYNIKEIILFRLSGLNKEYIKIIKNFSTVQ